MFQTEFQVTLPSTSSIQFFPQNKPSHYYTMLKSPLQLEGEWEVALMDVQYPFNWNNFPGAEVAVIVYVKEKGEKILEREHLNEQRLFDNVSCKELRNKVTDYYNEKKIEYSAILIIKIPAGHYKSPEGVMEQFTGVFNNDDFEGENPAKIFSIFNPLTKVFQNRFENMYYCHLISRGTAFFNSIGIKAHPFGDNYFHGSMMGILPSQCELPSISTMYIYTDIIKWQRVGDNEAPLLATLPVPFNAENQLFWSFNPPYYVPVSQEIVNTIEIKLATDEGNDFPIDPPGKVICRLNFRRRRINL